MHEWMGDNGHTPHIVVDATVDGVVVPREHVKDGKIILNISETAAHNLQLVSNAISFRARFSGVPFDVRIPMRAVMGIYARETGQGMIFSHDASAVHERAADAGREVNVPRGRPHLKVIK